MPEPPVNKPSPELEEISWDELPVTPASATPADREQESISLGVCLGTTTIPSGKAEQLCQDQLVTMDQAVGDPVSLFLGGVLHAQGILVTLNGQFGIRITDLHESKNPASM